MSNNTYYATTPIFYVNAEPHIGHAYTTILVDVVTRYHRLKGDNTFFLTGTDEHGEKIQKAADAAGISPQAYTDKIAAKFRNTWDDLGIRYDEFIRTTEERHKKVVNEILQTVYDKGDIIFGEYGGLYCIGCERYLTEKELVDGKCKDHDTVPEYRSEENYFFRMEKYRPWLIEYIEDNPDFIRPERYRNEVLGILREPIGDLSISRPKDRVPWGIPLPWDDNHVTYVWFDALINYYSALESQGTTSTYWPAVEHFIAKDILKPHGVFWPTMLKSAGLPIYQHLNVHGYWLTDTGKMSKSKGNVVKPLDLKDKYGNDAFRYYLLKDMSFGLDSTFGEVGLAERINADLANDLGNLLNRTLGMLKKYTDGVIPESGEATEADVELLDSFKSLPSDIDDYFEKLQFERAIERTMESVRLSNRYIAENKPWELAKDESQKERLNTVLYNCVEALRCSAIALSPIIPNKSVELLAQLGLGDNYTIEGAGNWGLSYAGTVTQPGEPLFPKIDMDALNAAVAVTGDEMMSNNVSDATVVAASTEAVLDNANETDVTGIVHKDEVTIDDFAKLEFRVAEIVACENHPKADKLLVLSCKLGDEERTIVSGIRQWYDAEDLVGKKVIIVANLKPVKLRGVLSQGMIMAAEDADGNLAVSALDRDIASGSEVR